jgi:multicomponent Na+:H+ antiporter subunit E
MPDARANSPLLTHRYAVVLTRLVVLLPLWAALVEGNPQGLLMGFLALPLAMWGGFALEAPGGPQVRPLALLGLLPFCAWRALRGALDVARRALLSQPCPTPGRIQARSRLPEGPARNLLNGVVSLLPGTLALEVEGDCLILHLLETSPGAKAAALAQLRELERRVARVFGLQPPPRGLS